MAFTSATNLAAIIPSKNGRLIISTRNIPTPGPGELLVRNHAIAGNPVDWKIQDYALFVSTYPTVLGSDVAGTVVSVGQSVTHFAPGDRVIGFSAVIYNDNADHGAWQTYTLLREVGASKLPASMTFEQGSVFPMAMATAAIALFVILGIPQALAQGDEVQKPSSALLVWGAASSVGASAVQIARSMGLTVFATASPQNHGWLKQLGAAEVLDYHDVDVVAKLVKAAKARGTSIDLAFDPISEGATFDQVPATVAAAGVKGKGKVATVLWWPEGKEKPGDVQVDLTVAMRHGTDQEKLGRWFFNEWLEKAMKDGTVVPAPRIEIVEGGVEAAQKVFDMLKKGVSGKKLVVQVRWSIWFYQSQVGYSTICHELLSA